jgi:hypothetical protein
MERGEWKMLIPNGPSFSLRLAPIKLEQSQPSQVQSSAHVELLMSNGLPGLLVLFSTLLTTGHGVTLI